MIKFRKRIISSALVAVMLLGTFASCSNIEPRDVIDSAITVATSDAGEYAA